MFPFNDPEMLWLNATNIALGVVTIVCLFVVVRALYTEIRVRKQKEAGVRREEAGHKLYVSELGLTMADGGEKVKARRRGKRKVPHIGKN